MSHFWDHEESKLIVCEAKILPPDQVKNQPAAATPDHNKNVSLTKATMDETVNMAICLILASLRNLCLIAQVETLIVSLFVSVENGVLTQDSFPLSNLHHKLLGLESPYFYFSKTVSFDVCKHSEKCIFCTRQW
jgi:hypothetical protein